MKKLYFQSFLLIIISLFTGICLKAQVDISGVYDASGYFFHPSSPRALSKTKAILKIADNRYRAQLGDVGLEFEFSLDTAYHLTDWLFNSQGQNYPSGFMTSDNPGGFVYSSPQQPGDSPWVHSTYDNTYDTVTHTLYVHCGYSVISGDTGESSYTRQVYEKWVFVHPAVVLTSFSPRTGTAGTYITIKGQYLNNLYSVNFGNAPADTAWAVSDTEVIAVAGAGATGNISVSTFSGTDSIAGFTYIPPVITNTQWVSAGHAGFSPGAAKTVNIIIDKTDHPLVVFSDSLNGYKTRVMKLNDAGTWVNVGDFVSDGASSFTNIVIDNNGTIYTAFIDSANNNNITVKKFSSSAWKTIGNPGFAPCNNIFSFDRVSIALDGNGNPSVVSAVLDQATGNYKLSVFHFEGSRWVQLGNADIGANSPNGFGSIAINRKTNVPYIVADDINLSGVVVPQLIVKAYMGGVWSVVGNPHFTSGTFGAYFPDIVIDSSGAPLVCVQEDNGRERASMYRFDGSDWMPVGPKFISQAHAFAPSLAVDKNNMPVVGFLDARFNEQETVMRYDSLSNSWELVGARGFAPCNNITQNALALNSSNIPYIAFADKTKGNKVTVMHYAYVLPVALVNFTASLQKQNVLVNWQTATETNTSFFNIQRSVDGLHFINISRIAAYGNSTVGHDYDYTDFNVVPALNVSTVYYRLQTVDKDNHFTYSSVISIQLTQFNISLMLWPNPLKDVLNIKLGNYNGDANISIYNLDGKKIKERATTITNQSTIEIAAGELKAGVYIVSITAKNQVLKEKFIKR